MSLTRLPGCTQALMRFPQGPFGMVIPPALASATAITAANSGLAFVGTLVHESAEPGTAKTINKIHFLPGTVSGFANAGTNLRIGLQGVQTGNSAARRPDGTYLSAGNGFVDIAGNGTVPVSNTWFTTAILNSGSGTAVTVGNPLAVVITLTAVVVDTPSLTVQGISMSAATTIDRLHVVTNRSTNVSGNVWQTLQTLCCNVLFEFSDGTWGTIHGGYVLDSVASAVTCSTGGTEYGIILQLPFPVTVCGFYGLANLAATATGTWSLYSAPLGTPVQQLSFNVDVARNRAAATASYYDEMFGGTYDVAANTAVCLALGGTAAAAISVYNTTVNATGHLGALAGSGIYGVSRTQGTSNSFVATNSTKDFPLMGVVLSRWDAGGGGTRGIIYGS